MIVVQHCTQVVDNLCRNHNLVVLTPADRQAEPLCITVLLIEPQPKQQQCQQQHAPCCRNASSNNSGTIDDHYLNQQYTCTSPPSLKMSAASAAVARNDGTDNETEVS